MVSNNYQYTFSTGLYEGKLKGRDYAPFLLERKMPVVKEKKKPNYKKTPKRKKK